MDSIYGVMLRVEKVFLGVGLSVKTAIKHYRQERVRGRQPPKETALET